MAKIPEDSTTAPIRDIILNTVNTKPGINAVGLILDVMSVIGPVKFTEKFYQLSMDDLLKKQEIIEVEYTTPQAEYRTKSLYFPRGTLIEVIRVK